ncbi:STAS domain-containing protein [Pontibacter silvestris]|uniref:Anti-sigma factor antagonist n=1 Tax=Pontibacter silvestris TaxID=2305183 RepID=A0ABW4WTT5_9BACT|nr:STAS domain-containing protein [Pontibacter silvestris]MCC9138629.1 STAS domain-containing protein [Pontibacter silvestris]
MKKFNIEYKEVDSTIRIRIIGELDASTCIAAEQCLKKASASGAKKIMIDCQELSYISSAGIGVLLSTYYACSLQSTLLILYSMPLKVKDVFETLGLDKTLFIKGSLEEALELT